jgi:mono/diheme cytochrome c family protein
MKIWVIKISAVAIIVLAVIGASTYAADASQGRQIYQLYCSSCHGVDGVGYAGAAVPDLRSFEIQQMSETELKQVITYGKDRMPPNAGIPWSSLDDLVAYVKSLSK